MRRFQSVGLLVALLIMILVLGAPIGKDSRPDAALGVAIVSAQGQVLTSEFVFEGCWAYVSAGPCYDIFRDSSGAYWICKACGTTKNANKKSCQPISLEQLNRGFWCS